MTFNPWNYGDGTPTCKFCKGRGVTEMRIEDRPPGMITPATVICSCVTLRDRLKNMDGAWPGLSLATSLKAVSSLDVLIKKNVWITAPTARFRAHLHRVAKSQSSLWHFLVASDADIMTSWLGSVAIKGAEIFDTEASISTKHVTIVDLVEPPSLLILLLGIKTARNAATAEVVLEALQHRLHVGKPTWVIDQPEQPLKPGHLAYSPALAEILAAPNWTRRILNETGVVAKAPAESSIILATPEAEAPYIQQVIQVDEFVPKTLTPLDKIRAHTSKKPKKGKGYDK